LLKSKIKVILIIIGITLRLVGCLDLFLEESLFLSFSGLGLEIVFSEGTTTLESFLEVKSDIPNSQFCFSNTGLAKNICSVLARSSYSVVPLLGGKSTFFPIER